MTVMYRSKMFQASTYTVLDEKFSGREDKTMLGTIINGLSLGSIYALIALGYTMVYGVAKMLNFAHGDIIMVGAYTLCVGIATMGNVWLSIIIAVIICTALGVFIEKLAYKPLRSASPLAVLITAIGVSYFLQSTAQLIFGAKPLSVTIVDMGSVSFGSAQLNMSTILTLIVSVIIMIALTVFIDKSKTGRAMLAVSEDKAAAKLMGINVNATISKTFAIGSCLATFASIFYLMQIPTVEPTLGSMPGIKAFTASVIGGIGSVPGAVIGGILMGIIEKLSLSVPVLAPYTTAIEFSILILILLVKPTGILGKKRREKV